MALLIQASCCHISLVEKLPSQLSCQVPQCLFPRRRASPRSRLYRTLLEMLMDFLHFLYHCVFMVKWRHNSSSSCPRILWLSVLATGQRGPSAFGTAKIPIHVAGSSVNQFLSLYAPLQFLQSCVQIYLFCQGCQCQLHPA